MKKVSFKINLAFSICVFLGSVYKYFIGSGLRMDLFIFYEHPKGGRLLSNILVDISNMVTISTVLLMWYLTTRKRTIKNAITPFLTVSILDIIDYFFYYKQMSSIKLLILITLIIIFNLKWQSTKQ
jgi:TRAP-type C4-dicarboxylate transport system permease small subunit